MDSQVQCIKCGRIAEVKPSIVTVTDNRPMRPCRNVDVWICIEHVEEWKWNCIARSRGTANGIGYQQIPLGSSMLPEVSVNAVSADLTLLARRKWSRENAQLVGCFWTSAIAMTIPHLEWNDCDTSHSFRNTCGGTTRRTEKCIISRADVKSHWRPSQQSKIASRNGI